MENKSSANSPVSGGSGFVKSCKKYFRALHIRVIAGKKTPENNDKECVCLNCGTTFVGNYCNRCGQSANTHQYHFKKVPENIAGGLFHVEEGFGNTLLNLLYRPGYMIKDFIQGKRVNYIQPFHMLFVLAALYLMVSHLVEPMISDDILQKDMIENTMAAPDADEEEARAIIENVKTRMSNALGDNKWLVHIAHLLQHSIEDNRAVQDILFLPFTAMLTMLVFRRKGKATYQYSYTEYLIMEAFICCQTLLITFLYLPFNPTGTEPVCLTLLFELYAYKQIFQLGWFNTMWRLFLTYLYLILLILGITLAFVLAYYLL